MTLKQKILDAVENLLNMNMLDIQSTEQGALDTRDRIYLQELYDDRIKYVKFYAAFKKGSGYDVKVLNEVIELVLAYEES